MSNPPKQFPEGMIPLGKNNFNFRCHPEVACFKKCCRRLELFIYPFDVIKLKNHLRITSAEFLNLYAGLVAGRTNPHFPSVVLRMRNNEEYTCPFLTESGCSVYEDRPSACRTYPLERAVDRDTSSGRPDEYYFMTNHDYCLGHEEPHEMTVDTWLQDQNILTYNMMDDLWAEMDTLFLSNPWQGEGEAGPLQRLAFMACYNIDDFRDYARLNNIFRQFKLSKSQVRALDTDDEALLRFAYKWLQFTLAQRPTLTPRRRR